jgi:hypothetical protein
VRKGNFKVLELLRDYKENLARFKRDIHEQIREQHEQLEQREHDCDVQIDELFEQLDTIEKSIAEGLDQTELAERKPFARFSS